MKDYNNIVSLWVRGFTMEKENKADLCSVLVKLGLAVMSVAYPQTGSQAPSSCNCPSLPRRESSL